MNKLKTNSSPTKDKLMDVATRLMLEKGFVATTVDEICEAAQVTKGSFFHYFESKEDLAKAIIQAFICKGAEAFKQGCCEGMDPLDRVYAYLECACEMPRKSGSRGCLLGTLVQEISKTHPELRALCEKGFNGMTALLKDELRAAKLKYAPKADFDPEELAVYFLSVFQGSMLVMKASGDTELLDQNLRHLKGYLKNLYGR